LLLQPYDQQNECIRRLVDQLKNYRRRWTYWQLGSQTLITVPWFGPRIPWCSPILP
jgi:hypothetical protein